MQAKIEQFTAKNPNPVLSVEKDWTILYSNKAGEPLLNEWGVRVGEKLPSSIGDFVQRVISLNSPEKMEVKAGKRVYLVTFHLLPEEECVNIYGFDISDQKDLERKLRECEEDLAEVHKMAQIGNWKWDIVTNELHWSDEVYRIFRLNPQELESTYDAFFSYLHPDDRDCVNDAVKRALNGEPYSIDYRIILPGGERTVHSYGKVIFDEENIPIRMRGTTQDITERKRAEKALRESERRYHLLFENMMDGFAYCRMLYDDCGRPVDFIYLDTNSAFERLTGLKEVTGKRVTEVIPGIKELHPELFDAYGRVSLTGQPERFEIEFKPLGIWLYISVYSPEREHFVAVFDNITERKQAEEALQASEERLLLAQQVAKIGTFEWNIQTGVNVWTPELEAMYGLRPGEFGKTQQAWEQLVYPDDRPNALRLIEHAFQTGEPVEGEWRVVWPDGSVHWLTGRWQVFKDAAGQPLWMTGVNIDITERKRAEEALLQKEKELNDAQRIARVGSWYWDAETDANTVSDELLRIFGQDCPPFKEQKGTMYPPESWERLNAAVQKAVQTGVGYKLDIEALHGDGHTIWITMRGEAVHDANGVIIGLHGTVQDITEHKNAEEEREQLLDAVQQEKDRLAALINSITDEVWFADTQKNLTLINPSAMCEFSICAEEKIGVKKLATSLEVYRPDGSTRPVEEAPPLRALQGEVVKNQEEIVRTPVNGELRYRQVSAAPMHDTGGNIIGSVSVVRDITESKKAGEEIQNLANIVESSNDAIITKSFGGIITSWNKGAEQVYGYSAREALGKPISIIEPDSLKGEIEQLGEMIEQGDKIHNYETLRLRKDGTIIDVSITLSPVFDASGELVAISAIARDITESRRAEEKLRESEEKYRSIVETANEGILIIDDKAIVTYANQKLADMLGYTLEEGVGRPIWDFISEESKAIAKLNLEKRLHGINESYELKLICKDGSPLWALINAKSLFDKGGKFMGSMSMFTDITERKKAEDVLANIEIARKQEIHHRIKNNLQVISSLLDLQAEKFNNREDIKDSEVLAAFRKSQDRVISMALIHEELYKGGGIDTLDSSSYIQELTESLFLTYRLGNANISLNMDLEENIFLDMDTAVPLGIIVNELVSNSLKHAFIGKDKGEIRIKLHREGKRECKNENGGSTSFILTVSDNGVGIPENFDIEDQDNLGFLLVASLVDQLDGEFELKRNNGTDFTIRFTVTEKNKQASASVATT